MAKNYYEILGVDRKATPEEIKSQYRKLVKQYHPDLHPNDPDVAAKFKEINEANEVLSDQQKRAQYDYELDNPYAARGAGGASGFSGDFGGFSDIFSDIFSQFTGGSGQQTHGSTKATGDDVTVEVELSFMDAAKGCSKDYTYKHTETCESCHGTGAKNGTKYTTCDYCHGAGYVQQTSNAGFFRTVRTVVCPQCGGRGKKVIEKCPDCNGKGYNNRTKTEHFNIPAGVENGSYLKFRGKGNASINGGASGDLYVVFKVLNHKVFKRKNFDLYVDMPISFATAALGGKILVPTLDDYYELAIPECTQSGKQFTVKGKGIHSKYGVGNLFVNIIVEVPSKLSRSQKSAITDLFNDIDVKQSAKMNATKSDVESLFGFNPYSKT